MNTIAATPAAGAGSHATSGGRHLQAPDAGGLDTSLSLSLSLSLSMCIYIYTIYMYIYIHR